MKLACMNDIKDLWKLTKGQGHKIKGQGHMCNYEGKFSVAK